MSFNNKQIILTAGPASADPAFLDDLTRTATSVRLNTSHLNQYQLQDWLALLEKCRDHNTFRIVLDLQGAKARIGKINSTGELPPIVSLIFADHSDEQGIIPVPHQAVFDLSRPGDRLFLNDRKIILEILENSPEILRAKVVQNGALSSGKGINSPDRVFEMAKVTPNDMQAIKIAESFGDIDFAISFVADGHEASLFRKLVHRNARLIAKIEQREAFMHLDKIDSLFDETWLCRGDLGAEAGLLELGRLQAEFVKAMTKFTKPAIIAGEVLGSMVELELPTRAEIVQLYDAMTCGFSGLVLSDETAVGKNIEAVMAFIRQFFYNEEPGY